MKMKQTTVKEAINLLIENGFTFKSQKGSHIKYAKGSFSCNLVMHKSTKETLSPGVMKTMLSTIEKSKLQK